jgi:hypothetical protein
VRRLWFVLAAAAIVGCSGETFEPPARTPQVAAEEARVADLLEQRTRGAGPAPDGGCSVRILGIDRSTTYAWSTCEFRDPSGMRSGVSGPIRVDGDDVRSPSDGSGYDDSVREMFPAAMAEAIFKDQNRLRPVNP